MYDLLLIQSNKCLSNDFLIPLEATKNLMITFPCLLLILGQHHTWWRGDYNVEIMGYILEGPFQNTHGILL